MLQAVNDPMKRADPKHYPKGRKGTTRLRLSDICLNAVEKALNKTAQPIPAEGAMQKDEKLSFRFTFLP